LVAVVIYVRVGNHRYLCHLARYFFSRFHSYRFILPVLTLSYRLIVELLWSTAHHSPLLLLFFKCLLEGVFEGGVILELISDKLRRRGLEEYPSHTCWVAECIQNYREGLLKFVYLILRSFGLPWYILLVAVYIIRKED